MLFRSIGEVASIDHNHATRIHFWTRDRSEYEETRKYEYLYQLSYPVTDIDKEIYVRKLIEFYDGKNKNNISERNSLEFPAIKSKIDDIYIEAIKSAEKSFGSNIINASHMTPDPGVIDKELNSISDHIHGIKYLYSDFIFILRRKLYGDDLIGELQRNEISAKIKELEVIKYHLTALLNNVINYFDIISRSGVGVLSQDFNDNFQAHVHAKIQAAKVTIDKYGLGKTALTDNELYEVYVELDKQPPEIRSYLRLASSLIYGAFTGTRSYYIDALIGKLPTLGEKRYSIPWETPMLENFINAGTRNKSTPPEGFKSISDFKRSNEFDSWASYRAQFDQYRAAYVEYEAQEYGYAVLDEMELNGFDRLNYYDQKKSPRRAWLFELWTSPQTGGASLWANANCRTDSTLIYGTRPGELRFTPGAIGVIELENKEVLVVSTIDGEICTRKFTAEEAWGNNALKSILQNDFPSRVVERYMDGLRFTNSYLVGGALICYLLKPVWKNDDNPITRRTKPYKANYGMTSDGSYPFLLKTTKSEDQIDVTGKSVLAVIQEIIKKSFTKASYVLHHANKDETFWTFVGSHFVPFYDTIFGSLYQADYKINTLELVIEVGMTCMMLVPIFGSVAKLSTAMKAAVRNSLQEGMKKGLRGVPLRRHVAKQLVKNELVKQALKAAGKEVTELAFNLFDPSPIPTLFSPTMSQLFRGRSPEININNKKIILNKNPEPNKKKVLVDSTPYKGSGLRKNLLCGSHHRNKRALGDFACFGSTKERRRNERLAKGDISPLSDQGPFGMIDVDEMDLSFDYYRYDDIGAGIHFEKPEKKYNIDRSDKFFRKATGNGFGSDKLTLSESIKVIDILNGESGTNALKMPLNRVTTEHQILAHSGPLSGCTMIYAVKGDHFYIYHAGLRSNAEGLDKNWKTAREGINTIAKSHTAMTGETLPDLELSNNSLIDIFSSYDSVVIVYMGKKEAKITRNIPHNISVFNYDEIPHKKFTGRIGSTQALLTRIDSEVKIEVLAEDYFNPMKPHKSEKEVFKDFDVINKKITRMGNFVARPDRVIRLHSLSKLYENAFFNKILLDNDFDTLMIKRDPGAIKTKIDREVAEAGGFEDYQNRNGIDPYAASSPDSDIFAKNTLKMMVEVNSPINPLNLPRYENLSFKSLLDTMDSGKNYVVLVNDKRLNREYLIDFPVSELGASREAHIIQSDSHFGVMPAVNFVDWLRQRKNIPTDIADLDKLYSSEFTKSVPDEQKRILASVLSEEKDIRDVDLRYMRAGESWEITLFQYIPDQFERNMDKISGLKKIDFHGLRETRCKRGADNGCVPRGGADAAPLSQKYGPTLPIPNGNIPIERISELETKADKAESIADNRNRPLDMNQSESKYYTDLIIYRSNKAVWDENVAKGSEKYTQFYEKPTTPVSKEIEYKQRYEEEAEQVRSEAPYIDDRGRVIEPDGTVITLHVQGDATVLYRFRVSDDGKVLVVDNMYGNLDKGITKNNIGGALPMNEFQGEFIKSRPDLLKNIKYITQERIANENTQQLLRATVGASALRESRGSPISLTPDGLSAQAFRAMLNTPNVQPTARMLSTYPGIGKEIIEIRIQGVDRITLVLGDRRTSIRNAADGAQSEQGRDPTGAKRVNEIEDGEWREHNVPVEEIPARHGEPSHIDSMDKMHKVLSNPLFATKIDDMHFISENDVLVRTTKGGITSPSASGHHKDLIAHSSILIIEKISDEECTFKRIEMKEANPQYSLVVPSEKYGSMALELGVRVDQKPNVFFAEHGDTYKIHFPSTGKKFSPENLNTFRRIAHAIDQEGLALKDTPPHYGSGSDGLYNCNTFVANILSRASGDVSFLPLSGDKVKSGVWRP